jgi:DNA-binding transcriptional ArsR family regulator/protein-L-isoaspartate O-methyltransferase
VPPKAKTRADLFRLLGDEDRLRLLALCDADELTVGELAELLRESQPQVTRKTQPLRDAGLLHARRDGTRILLRADAKDDAVVAAALEAGKSLCLAEGTLSRVPSVVARREEASRNLFAAQPAAPVAVANDATESFAGWATLLQCLAPLLPRHGLAVDVGTGDGALLPVLASLYDRVIAVDRSAARLAQAAARLATLAIPNVRLREWDAENDELAREIEQLGGADLVLLSRVLTYVATPRDLVSTAGRWLRPGGHLVIIDFVPHSDESLREAGHVWLGFEPAALQSFLSWGGLTCLRTAPLHSQQVPPLHMILGQRPL